MHSADYGKKLKCTNCGKEFSHPLCDTYEYKGVDRFYTWLPETAVGYCNHCKKFVCIQRGIRTNDVKEKAKKADNRAKEYFNELLNVLQGRDSVDACAECGSTDFVYLSESVCPDCGGQKVKVEREEGIGSVKFHFGRIYILPKLAEATDSHEYARGSYSSNVDNNKKKNSTLTDVLRWIVLLPSVAAVYTISYWIVLLLNSLFNIYSISASSIEFISSLICTYLAVTIGCIIAPKGKKVVSVVFATIFSMISLLSLFLYFNSGYDYDNNTIVASIGTIIGAICGSVFIYKQDD